MKKILIIQATFYDNIADMLFEGALPALKDADIEYDLVKVPGCFEIPAVIAMAENTRKYAGYIALGCVIRGETSHYDYVCKESIRGLSKLAIKFKTAIGNGILTVENMEQAVTRADSKQKNKGYQAALACIKMMEIKNNFNC